MKRTTAGLVIILAPIATFILGLMTWPILLMVQQAQSVASARTLNIVFGLLNLGSLIAIPICLAVGILMMSKPKHHTDDPSSL